ncbi:hypothetical protein CcCBS67573_g07343 [Chytriomyces confervae]|uniref:Uncharacterized protein n=1 Tax=Chytriomyces confervae TaxID=246404 RepID=A0A507EV70_9FUNG|nr:hypothetical protein CcCBS67573_g07343 [Chytriomyces confervae]
MQSYFASMAGSGIGIGTLTTQVGLSNTAFYDPGSGIPVTGPVSVQGAQPQRIRVKLPKSLAAKNQPTPPADTYPAEPESTAMPSARISLKDLRSSKLSSSQHPHLSSSPPSSSPASKPTQSHNDMDPQTMKAQVNDRAVRKIMDLEIANESLLAVNTTLENTIREQALNLEQMRRLVGMLKRKYGADLQPAQQPFTNSIVDDLSQSPVDEKEIELQFNRVCGTISQLIQDGTRALNIRGPTPREPKRISQPEPITISPPAAEPEPIPSRQTPSPKPVSPPTTTSTSRKPSPLSTSTTPASSKRASGTVSPPRSASNPPSRASTPNPMKRIATTTSTRSAATTPKPSAPRKQSTSSEPSVELIVVDAERIYKKARLLMTARHAYSKRALSLAIEQEDRAIEDEMDEQQQTSFSKSGSSSTVAIPRSLYGTLVELVEAVHQDLIGSYERKHEGNENYSATGNVRNDGSVGIIAGGFAIGVGTVSGAVMVGGNTKKKTEEPASWTVPDVKRRVASPVPGAKRPPLSSTMGAGGARNLGSGKTLVAQRAVAGARKGLM